MEHVSLYTAVGRLTTRLVQGEKRSIVLVGGQEHYLDETERKVWGLLIWQVLTGTELDSAFLRLSANPEHLDRYRDTLHRLAQRGLVVRTDGRSVNLGLAFDLISRLNIMPQHHPGLLKVVIFAIMVSKGAPVIDTRKMLQAGKDPDTRVLLGLASQTDITTAELVRCVDLQIRSVPDEATLVRQLYTDCAVTSANMPELARRSENCDLVTAKVLSAYRAGLIVFDKA